MNECQPTGLTRVAVLATLLVLQACGGGGGGSSPAEPPGAPPPAPYSIPPSVTVDARAGDIEWVPQHNLLYASLPSINGAAGNTLVAIEPGTGRIVHQARGGSEPGEMAVSDDGRFLYVAQMGAGRVQRYLLPELTPDIGFAMPRSGFGDVQFAIRLQTVPGQARTLVVTTGGNLANLEPDTVTVFDDGVARAQRWSARCSRILVERTGERIFCADLADPASFREARLDATGAVPTGQVLDFAGLTAPAAGLGTAVELIQGPAGDFFNAVTAETRRFPAFTGPLVYDAPRQLYHMASVDGQMRSFVASNMAPLPVVRSFPAIGDSPRLLTRWGDGGLALATERRLFLFGGTSPVSLDTRVPEAALVERRLDLTPYRLAWDAVGGRLYATVSRPLPATDRQVVQIDPSTLAVTQSRILPDGAGALAVSDDGQFLYVGVDADDTVRRLRLPALDEDLVIPLGTAAGTVAPVVSEIAVAPGRPSTLAVSTLSGGVTGSGIDQFRIFDGATARPRSELNPVPPLAFRPDPVFLAWSGDGTRIHSAAKTFSVVNFGVDATGLATAAANQGTWSTWGLAFNPLSNTLILTDGTAFDALTLELKGRYRRGSVADYFSHAHVVDPVAALVYAIEDDSTSLSRRQLLVAYDLHRYVALKAFVIPTNDAIFLRRRDLLLLRPGLIAVNSFDRIHFYEFEPPR